MSLFGPIEQRYIFLSHHFWDISRKVSASQIDDLIKPFALEEIKHAMMDMKKDSAWGPNGFGPSFFHNFWDLIKGSWISGGSTMGL